MFDIVPFEHHIYAKLPAPPAVQGAFMSIRRFAKILLKMARSGRINRGQDFVQSTYENVYSLPNTAWLKENQGRRLEVAYRKRHFIVNGLFMRAVHNELIAKALKSLGCGQVLEVGSGRGNNLMSIAGAHPEIRFAGLEFTKSGVRQSRSWHEEPEAFREIALPSVPQAVPPVKSVAFETGSALAMPFQDKSFDAAFTILALEQIPHDYPGVLAEMRRVSKGYCLFIEPFAEANTALGKLNLLKADYFRFRYRTFRRFGLEPIFFSSDFPQKVKYQMGFLIARVVHERRGSMTR